MCVKCEASFCSPLILTQHFEKKHGLKFIMKCGLCGLGFAEADRYAATHATVCGEDDGSRKTLGRCTCGCDATTRGAPESTVQNERPINGTSFSFFLPDARIILYFYWTCKKDRRLAKKAG
jgi:hypothetical protein